MFFYVVESCGWYLLIPISVFVCFVFIPDYAANWLIENDYLLRRRAVKRRLLYKTVCKILFNSINVSLKSNNFTYEYQY